MSGKAKAMHCRSQTGIAPDYVLEPQNLVEMIPALRAFARKFNNQKADVEDLVQETLVKAIANRHTYAPYAPLKSWLFTIMRNTVCSRIRRQSREVPGLADCVSRELVIKPSQQDALEAHEVQLALETLPDTYQRVLSLVVFEGKSYERTAELCACSIGTVKSRLHRARDKLQAIVDAER